MVITKSVAIRPVFKLILTKGNLTFSGTKILTIRKRHTPYDKFSNDRNIISKKTVISSKATMPILSPTYLRLMGKL